MIAPSPGPGDRPGYAISAEHWGCQAENDGFPRIFVYKVTKLIDRPGDCMEKVRR
jgi:hypothetical protein